MSGTLVEIHRSEGVGFPSFDTQYAGISLGSGPGARKRGGMSLAIPRPEESACEVALLSVGVRTKAATVPFRWRLAVDGSTISREFKPQFRVEADESTYYRVVYDAKPLLYSKLVSTVDHRLQVLYDGFQPIVLSDASMLAVFKHEKSRYSVSYHTGAMTLTPGDVVKVDANIGNSFGGERIAIVSVYVPSPHAVIEVIAGGSEPLRVEGPGYRSIRVKVPYRGYMVPVAVRYRESDVRFYPKTAIITDVVVMEATYPVPRLKLVVDEVYVDDDKVSMKGYVENIGDDWVRRPLLVVLGMGVQLLRMEIDDIEPGGERVFTATVNVSRLPVKPSKLSTRIIWSMMGKTIFDEVIVRLYP
ncbi:MAG: hypothetical protein F7C81_05035 [Desulfurococcales archaeon]|nr:hypothetical protein [Desulfurococcales archaeon]